MYTLIPGHFVLTILSCIIIFLKRLWSVMFFALHLPRVISVVIDWLIEWLCVSVLCICRDRGVHGWHGVSISRLAWWGGRYSYPHHYHHYCEQSLYHRAGPHAVLDTAGYSLGVLSRATRVPGVFSSTRGTCATCSTKECKAVLCIDSNRH